MTAFDAFHIVVLAFVCAAVHVLHMKIMKLMQIESRLESLAEKFRRHESFHETADWKRCMSHCCGRCGGFLKDGQICGCLSIPKES